MIQKTKNKTLAIAAIIAFVTCSCNFSVGTKKDFATGVSFNYKGFRVQDVALVDSANQKLSSKTIPFNARVGLLVSGLSNYSLKDGLASPGMTVEIQDKQGSPVVGQSPDLFSANGGFSAQDASVLLGSVMISAPMKQGETYRLKTHVWDKNNSANVLDAEVEVVVK